MSGIDHGSCRSQHQKHRQKGGTHHGPVYRPTQQVDIQIVQKRLFHADEGKHVDVPKGHDGIAVRHKGEQTVFHRQKCGGGHHSRLQMVDQLKNQPQQQSHQPHTKSF